MPPRKPSKPKKSEKTTRTTQSAKSTKSTKNTKNTKLTKAAPPKESPAPRKIDLKPSTRKIARVARPASEVPSTPKAALTAPETAPADLKPAPPSADLRRAGAAPVLKDIPWGYGDSRVTAMARDPHWAFTYWEVTDAAIDAARARLREPQHSSLHLRIYDTTHRDFNGLNAHHHWDLGVSRETVSYTFRVGRPGCTVHVDVGLRSPNGDFSPIARSGAVEMPRDSMSPNGNAQWSTVLRNSPGYGYRHKYVAPPYSPPPPSEATNVGNAPAEFEPVFQSLSGEGWTRTEWTETRGDGRVFRWIKWSGPLLPDQIPFLPVAGVERIVFKNVDVLFEGERRVVKVEGAGERHVFGPWKIQLEAVGPKGEKRTIHQWAVKHRWTTEQGRVKVQTPAILTRILGGRRVVAAKSGSDERLAHESWGSEILVGGGSELHWIGSSESLQAGSSETLHLAASESLFLAASQWGERGASEQRWGGASELYGHTSEERP